ncbi:MAG: hypothetical protein AB7O66_24220 [Limisphaerales bacterium]
MLAKSFIALTLLFFCLQAQQAHYRWRLFHHDYGAIPFSNHVGDDAFILLHMLNSIALLGCTLSTWAIWKSSHPWRLVGIACSCANGIVWAFFHYMHRTGVLVTYIEFIRHVKGLR